MGRHLTRLLPLVRLAGAAANIASEPPTTGEADDRPPDTIGEPAPQLVWTTLVPPTPRTGLITRGGLQSLLQAGLEAKLCLLDAPAGYGKTTLLAQWCATAEAGTVAWVSLDEGHNDPTHFWISVAEALRTVQHRVGAAALQALHRTSANLDRVVLPSLLNDLNKLGSPLALVWTTTTSSPTSPATRHSTSSWTTSQPASTWCWRRVSTRRCPWARCEQEESWPRSASPS
jgi:hypothetical protein